MHPTNARRRGGRKAAALVAAAVAGLTAPEGRAVADGPPQACTVELRPATVLVQERPVRTTAVPSTPLEGEVTAAVEEASGMRILSVEPAPSGEAVRLRLATDRGRAGDWELVLMAREVVCTGTLTLLDPDLPARASVLRGVDARRPPPGGIPAGVLRSRRSRS